MFRRGNKYSFNGDGHLDCEFLTSFHYDYQCNIGLVNHLKKEVSPCHGYHYPNKCAKSLMNYALKLGYTYVDSGMSSKTNKTLLKKIYKSARKEDIFLGQIKEICSSIGILEKYEVVDIISQKFEREAGATWYMSKVALKRLIESAESEDERIRKEIIQYIKDLNKTGNLESKYSTDWIAWLEKHKDYVSPQMVADAYLKGCNDTENKLLNVFDKC